jgi:hypothetical protein
MPCCYDGLPCSGEFDVAVGLVVYIQCRSVSLVVVDRSVLIYRPEDDCTQSKHVALMYWYLLVFCWRVLQYINSSVTQRNGSHEI